MIAPAGPPWLRRWRRASMYRFSRRVDDDVLAVRYQRHCICLDRHRRPEATVFELLQKLARHCERTEKALPAVGAAIIRHCVEHDR